MARLSDDSINYRRTSLQVNLSCVSNLTDSGNESLRHTDVECHYDAAARKIKCAVCLQQNASRYSDKKRTFLDVPLKNASIILKRINHDDAILNKSCERLKTAILIKTNQMFDEPNELSVKTRSVLTAKDDRLDSGSVQNIQCASNENVSTISSAMNYMKSLSERINANQNINDTSRDKCISEERRKGRKRDTYNKRRLFVTKEESNNENINDNSNKDAMIRTDENPCFTNASSNTLYKFVLSGTSKNCGIDNFIISENRNVSIANMSRESDTFMTPPIACSTMINESNELSGTEHEVQYRVENRLSSASNMRTKRNITSMEITDVCKGFQLCDRPGSLCQEFVGIATIDTDIEQTTARPYTDASTETENDNMEETSLNVNTSIDFISRSDKSIDKDQRKRKEKTYPTIRTKRNEDASLSFVKRKARESINTVRSSLQMNTSLNISESVQECDHGNKISSLIDTENDSRNESVNTGTCNIYKTKDRNSSETSDNCFNDENIKFKMKDKVNSVSTADRYDQVVNKIRFNERSYVEATPYPMYRSVMLRSQLRQNAESCTFRNNDQFNHDKIKLHNFNDMYFKDQENMSDNTIISNNLSHKRFDTKSPARVLVPLTNENRLEDANLKKVDKKRCKKKLMPLNEHSEVSLSPVEKCYSPPRCLKFRRKLLNRKNNDNKIDTNAVRRDEEDDENTCNVKKNRGKRAKKIVSKKIVVKKIVDQDILNGLEENRENFNKPRIDMHCPNINSSNDFQSSKDSCNTRRRGKKTHGISIVTTGLSNDDKGIVKSVVKALGSARIESNVTKHTTHVVTTGVRTINLLHGIIRGCWIVGLEWILKSLENDAWLNPQEYEMAHFSNAVLENRKDRQLFGSSYVPELFAACGYIHIENNTTPSYDVLKDLVKTAGGCITDNPEMAKVVIGTDGLKETWIFDCITSGQLQPYNHYVRG